MASPKDLLKRELWIKRISESKKGKPNPFKNKKHTEKTLAIMREKRKNLILPRRDIDIVNDANECAKTVINLIKQLQMVIKL